MTRAPRAAAVVLGAAILAQVPARSQSVPTPGAPLPGLLPAEFSEFRLGLDDFTEVETAEEGLGPAFNGTSCAACHSVPAIGGGSTVLEVRAGYSDASGARGLDAAGNTLIHLMSVPPHGCQVQIPEDVSVIAHRAPIPLFGAGLVEAVADATLLSLEDPFDRDRDGVSGRAGIVTDLASGERRVGRFGWKSQHATLLVFGADAYRNEMGITNDLFPTEVAFGIRPDQIRTCDPLPDPEDILDKQTGRRGIDNFASFMRFLAPLPSGETGPREQAGEQLFHTSGCVSCHVPVLQTGPSASPALHRQSVRLFSDLLLHDIDTGDGIPQGAATDREIRTPALWGLRFRRPLLHDGSAVTIEDAIRRHGGEAERSRRLFEGLDDGGKQSLLAFLRSL